jgi:hypothetical protein
MIFRAAGRIFVLRAVNTGFTAYAALSALNRPNDEKSPRQRAGYAKKGISP